LIRAGGGWPEGLRCDDIAPADVVIVRAASC
jgi:hypothetical protein